MGLGDGGGTPLGHREGVVRELFYGVPSIGAVVLADKDMGRGDKWAGWFINGLSV